MAGRPTSKTAPPFGQRLAALRKQKSWTQSELAKRLNTTVKMVTYYEREADNPSAEFVAKIATLFDVATDDLLGMPAKSEKVVVKPGPQSRLQQLTNRLASLPRQKQKVVVEMLEGLLQKTGS